MEHLSVGIVANFQARDALAAVVAVVVVHYLWIVIQFRRKTRPPGPFPLWPVLGNIPLLGKLPHQSLYKLAQQYGDIMELKLGSKRTMVVSSPAMAEVILKIQDHVFASRPASAIGEIMMYGYKDIACAPYGQHWRVMKKVCVLELFTAKRLESFKGWRAEEVSCFVQGIFERSKDGKPVNMRERLIDMAMNLVTRMLLKKRYFDSDNESRPEAEELKELIVETVHLGGLPNISDLIPYLKPFDLQGVQARMKTTRKRMDKFLDRLIEEHLKVTSGLDDAKKDFVAVMLSLPGIEQGSDRLENETVKAIIIDLILGGTDTSATTIEWTLVHLLKNPQVMKKAQEELDEVVGRERVVEEDDLPKLKYLHAIVKETLRLQPPVPLMPRESLAPCEIEGYHIPANTLLYVNAWAVHRHPSAYENPFEYNPDRFVGHDVDVKGQSFQFLPFGSGKRVCPGMSLGITMVQFGLARFLQSFNCSLPAGEKPEDIDMSEIFGIIVPKAIPMQVVATARLPLHLYTAK